MKRWIKRRVTIGKVIAFYGSPRKDGDTAKLIEKVIAGAKSAGAEVVTYDLNEDGVKGCQGCYYCRANEGCATKDKLQSMYQEIKEATGIVAGFPIYFYDVGAQSKILIDRLFPMIDGNFAPRYKGKKVVTVYAQGQPDKSAYKDAVEKNNSVFSAFGWDLIESFICSGDADSFLDKAIEVGKQLAK